MKIQDGIPFSMQDVDSAAKVAIVGKTVTDALFTGGEDPVGQNIRIRKVQFTIIGTLVPKGQSANGEDQDDQVIIPITTLKKKVQGGRQNNIQQVGQIIVQARDEQGPAAVEQIAALLRQRHRIQPNDDDDFQVRSLEDIAAAQEQQANIMGLLLASIASVSLIVGGIGIMNIMLVSVTERTKEIGLRQAVGAKTGDILSQFLVEAVTLSVLGGVIGIILGVIGSLAITYFVQWNTLISLPSIISAFVFSALVGVFFGYYPARKAAYLDPIEALRYE
jgi:putative ABC transport system permease protein